MTSRRTAEQRPKEISTALLLPGVHPWLKAFFVGSALVPIVDETWMSLPKWEDIPMPTTSIAPFLAEHTQEECVVLLPTARPSSQKHVQTAPLLATACTPSSPPATVPIPSHTTSVPIIEAANSHTPMRAPSRVTTPDGARRSAAPTPFAIPIDAREVQHAPSRNILRITRAHRPILNLVSPLSERAEAVSTSTPQPLFRIPSPFNELLIVNVIVTPIEVLWSAFGYDAWQIVRRLPGMSDIPQHCMNAWERVRSFRPQFVNPIPRALRRPSVIHLIPVPVTAPVRIPIARSWRQSISFAAILLLILIPVKMLGMGAAVPRVTGRVLGATATAIEAFQSGAGALTNSSFAEAIRSFDSARATLEDLPDTAGPIPAALLRVSRHIPILRSTIGRAEEARRAGLALADASTAAARGLALLTAIDPGSVQASTYVDAAKASFSTARTHAQHAADALAIAAPQYASTVQTAMLSLDRATALLTVVEGLGGFDAQRRILLLFQNDAELRPTGGFMGSVALLDVASGEVRSLDVPGGGSYDISGLSRVRVLPPDPLLLLNDTWQFHDANWFPDFPASAEKIRWFYEMSDGSSVDAVVAVNASFLARVLELTGPVTIGEQTFTVADVIAELTNIVESHGARISGAPKSVIGDLAPTLLNRLLDIATSGSVVNDATNRIALVDLVLGALDTRDLQLVFSN
ncbi:MAG: DUF4012 domain-containing protein, partial [Candidatus Uhrbacteria bacterium]